MKTYPLPALLHLWWHCENSVGATETCRQLLRKGDTELQWQCSLLERMESRALRDLHIHIPHSTTHSSENVEATHIPTH